jgi:hypothetical protein
MRPIADIDYAITLRSEVDAALDRPAKSNVAEMDRKIVALKAKLKQERDAAEAATPGPHAKMHFLSPEELTARDTARDAAEQTERVRENKRRRVKLHASATYHARWMAKKRAVDPDYGRRGMHVLSASASALHKRTKRETDRSYGQ